MMAETARLFLGHGTTERIMASPDPREHKGLGRGVHHFHCAIYDRAREDDVLAVCFAKFTQDPVKKQHLLSTGSKRLAEASPFDFVCGICFRADDPDAQDPSLWRGKQLLEKSLSAVRGTLCSSKAGLAHTALAHQFCTPTITDILHEISPAPPRPLVVSSACPGPPLEVSTFFLTHRLIIAPRFWLSHLVSTPPSRCQNTAAASSGAPLLSMAPLLQQQQKAELAFFHVLVAWRFLTLALHRRPFDEMSWIACSRLVRHPSRASKNAPLVLGGGMANPPLGRLRRVYA